jgi:hypothetical protein
MLKVATAGSAMAEHRKGFQQAGATFNLQPSIAK